MIAQDVKLLCPAELRDTCMLLFHHMQKAFSGISFGGPRGPVRISTKKQQQGDGGSNASGSGSPRMLRARSDGSDASGGLSGRAGSGKLAAASAAAAAAVGGSGLRRAGSMDVSQGAAGAAADAAGPGGSSGTMVVTPFDEEVMLQRILKENAAAAAAAAAAADKRRALSRSRDLTASFSSSTAAAGDAAGHGGGQGHAAVAVRAVRADGEQHAESPRSGTLSDASHATDGSSLATAGAGGEQQRGAPAGPGTVAEAPLLLEYEIEFVQVQVCWLGGGGLNSVCPSPACVLRCSNTVALRAPPPHASNRSTWCLTARAAAWCWAPTARC
jgi:hypothetical protein